ncbi:YfbU family protein [Bacillaceae bacterium C204]|uniref:YfbU family protein n=1 Tax=Neobacillus sp. 204 TaxID=3383351 RepID=UPI003979A0F9
MNLSKVERLILINQFTILEKLNPEEHSYELNKEILVNGYKHNYGEIFECLHDEVSEEVSQEVWDILQMYRSLNFSYRNLEDKGDIDETSLKFRGFDGNNETNHMVYARFVLHDLDRYKELWNDEKYPDYNTHSPRIGKYRRMLSVWQQVSERYNNDLSIDEIKSILNA